MRLTKKQRLYEPKVFSQVFKSKFIVGHYCAVYYRTNSVGYFRLGIVASKRSVKLAVSRNQFKRLVRESFRFQQFNINPVDIIVVARKQTKLVSKQEIRECLDKQFQKLK